MSKMKSKSLFHNISFFTFFNLLNSAIPFLLLPILTRYLTPADYGIIDIFLNVSMLATPVIGLSIIQSISRFYFDDIHLPRFITTVFVILMVSGFIFILFSIISSLLFQDVIISYGMPPFLIVYALVYAFFSQISEVLLIVWRVSYNTVKFGIFRVAKTIMDVGLSLLLIVILNMGWEGRVFPQIFVAVLFAVVTILILKKNKLLLSLKIDSGYKNSAISFSTPMIFHSLGGNIIGFSDRFFILFMLGISDVGIYSVGYQIGMVVALFQNSYNQAWVPYFFERLKKGNEEDKLKIVKITYGYYFLLLIIFGIFYLVTPFIYEFMIGDRFKSGKGIVFWILLGYVFNGMYKMAVNYLFYLKETLLIAYSTFGAAFVNLVLNYFLIKSNGMEGAAQASAITFFLLFITIFVISSKKYKMPWTLK